MPCHLCKSTNDLYTCVCGYHPNAHLCYECITQMRKQYNPMGSTINVDYYAHCEYCKIYACIYHMTDIGPEYDFINKGESTHHRFTDCEACYKNEHIVYRYRNTLHSRAYICCQCIKKEPQVKQDIEDTKILLNKYLLDPSRIVVDYLDGDIKDGIIYNKNRTIAAPDGALAARATTLRCLTAPSLTRGERSSQERYA
jgi:hypothetical protein